VHYLPIDINGIEVRRLEESKTAPSEGRKRKSVDVGFDARYSPIAYDVGAAAKLVAGYALDVGATSEAMKALSKLTRLEAYEVKWTTDIRKQRLDKGRG